MGDLNETLLCGGKNSNLDANADNFWYIKVQNWGKKYLNLFRVWLLRFSYSQTDPGGSNGRGINYLKGAFRIPPL